jgi:hypothetical protein
MKTYFYPLDEYGEYIKAETGLDYFSVNYVAKHVDIMLPYSMGTVWQIRYDNLEQPEMKALFVKHIIDAVRLPVDQASSHASEMPFYVFSGQVRVVIADDVMKEHFDKMYPDNKIT